MIVSNFTPSTSGALQGVDLLARAPKAEQKGDLPSSFSDVLGATNRPDASVGDAREVRQQSRGSQAVAGGMRRPAPGVGRGPLDSAAPQPSDAGPTDAAAGDAQAAPVGLDGAPPLIRDSRLEDPAELALEAAAIAVAASLVQKAQELLPQPVVADEPNLDVGAEQGGGQAQADAEAPAQGALASISDPSALPLAATAQHLPAAAKQVVVSTEQKPAAVASGLSNFQTRSDRKTSQTPSSGGTSGGGVVPSIVASVVVTATPAQAVALADSTTEFSPDQQVQTTSILRVADAVAGGASAAGVSPVENNSQLSTQPADGIAQTPLHQNLVIQAVVADAGAARGPSDAELLSSPLPANPAQAFFAAQAQQQKPAATSAVAAVQVETPEVAGEAPSVALPVQQEPKSDDSSFSQSEKQGTGADAHSQQVKTTSVGAGGAPAPSSVTDSQAGSKVGTFGAKGEDVQSETSPASTSSEESSTPAKAQVGEVSSMSSSSGELSGLASTQNVTTVRPAHEVASRPTVLPPVHTKTSELFNVVQNALERARSENPSHLAVEVTLEDGSSFGLEVRMSASGLQASFRSESQPLLRALENSWSGFLAKESADSKVVSAAFEGRSGFGEFSNNGASTGERRQQFEDSASAALLGNPSGMKSAPGKTQGGNPGSAAGQPAAPSEGMALYA